MEIMNYPIAAFLKRPRSLFSFQKSGELGNNTDGFAVSSVQRLNPLLQKEAR